MNSSAGGIIVQLLKLVRNLIRTPKVTHISDQSPVYGYNNVPSRDNIFLLHLYILLPLVNCEQTSW